MNKEEEIKRMLESLREIGKCLFVGQVVGEQNIHINVTSEDVASVITTYLGAKVTPRPADAQRILPVELDTEEGRRLLQRAVQKGWLDASYRPLVSQRKSGVLAMVMGNSLRLQTERWKPFEQLWGMHGLSGLWSKAQLLVDYDRLVKEFERGLRESVV